MGIVKRQTIQSTLYSYLGTLSGLHLKFLNDILGKTSVNDLKKGNRLREKTRLIYNGQFRRLIASNSPI